MDLTTGVFGFLAGLLVGLTGMGGGALMGPVLILGLGVPPVVAGALYAWLGHVNFGFTLALLAGSIPGVLLGARLSVWSPERLLRPVLAAVLLMAGVQLIR